MATCKLSVPPVFTQSRPRDSSPRPSASARRRRPARCGHSPSRRRNPPGVLVAIGITVSGGIFAQRDHVADRAVQHQRRSRDHAVRQPRFAVLDEHGLPAQIILSVRACPPLPSSRKSAPCPWRPCRAPRCAARPGCRCSPSAMTCTMILVVCQTRARHTRSAVVQRALSVEQVRDLRQAPVRRGVHVFRRRVGMRRAGDDALFPEIGDHVQRARQFRRERHHLHAVCPPRHGFIRLHRRVHQAFAQLRALIFFAQERALPYARRAPPRPSRRDDPSPAECSQARGGSPRSARSSSWA